jgi:hypothetical protein
MNRWRVLAILLSIAGVATAATAQDDDKRFRVFATASWVEPMDDSQAILGGRTATLEAQGAAGWEAGLEWRFGRALGIEISYGRTSHDVDFGGETLGKTRFDPVCAALDVHVLRSDSADFWVAPTVVWLRWSAGDLRRGVEIEQDRKPQLGATLGFDWAIGPTWAITSAVRYVDAQLEFGGGGKVAVDPLTVRVGVAARF